MTEQLKFNDQGLIPAIAQDRLTGRVAMVAWMNQDALRQTWESGRATFFSRSRQAIWQKGESSGNVLRVHSIYADCDADVLLLLVDPQGPSCHTGRPTCFFRRLAEDGTSVEVPTPAAAFLQQLEAELIQRQTETSAKSYTRSLLDGGAEKIGEKLREEAGELAAAIANESDERVANEAADLVYHLMVALRLRDVDLRRVIEVLAKRSGTSGLEEKAARNRKQ